MNAQDEGNGKVIDERGRASLATELDPPEALEQRVLDELGRRGLIREIAGGRSRMRMRVRVGVAVAAAAAAIAIFFLGMLAGHRSGPPPLQGDFVLVLYGQEVPLEPAESARRVEEYRRWARGLTAGGRPVSGLKLDARRTIAAGSSSSPADLRHPVGFFIIRAASLGEAEEVAHSCPHLAHGGEIVIRAIDPT